MSGPVINANVVDALVLPRLVWLRPNLVGLVFTLSKLLPARFIVRSPSTCRPAPCHRGTASLG